MIGRIPILFAGTVGALAAMTTAEIIHVPEDQTTLLAAIYAAANGDGSVDVLDLLTVVTQWGACDEGWCLADVNP